MTSTTDSTNCTIITRVTGTINTNSTGITSIRGNTIIITTNYSCTINITTKNAVSG